MREKRKNKVISQAKSKVGVSRENSTGVLLGMRKKFPELRSKIRREADSRREFWGLLKVISVLMFVAGLYLIIYPFIPWLLYKLFYEGNETYPYQTNLEEVATNPKFGDEDIPEENRLVIPTIGVDMPIVEGNDMSVLNLGIWHRPGTGVPGFGNMVLTGHRVGYAFLPEDVRNSTSFYNLDKLIIGDFVIIYWEGKEYDYEIYDYEIVEPTAVHVESQEGVERLTLYTCDPIGENKKRLVYYAKPFSIEESSE